MILRDPVCGALEIRKQSAFLGYNYRQPVMVKDIVEEVLAEEIASTRLKDNQHGGERDDRDLIYEKRVFMEAGGQLSPSHRSIRL